MVFTLFCFLQPITPPLCDFSHQSSVCVCGRASVGKTRVLVCVCCWESSACCGVPHCVDSCRLCVPVQLRRLLAQLIRLIDSFLRPTLCQSSVCVFLPVPLPPRSVSTQRKPEEETAVHDSDAKQAKPEQNTVNGSSDSSANSGNGVQEGKSQQEASDGHVPFLYRRRGGDGACSSRSFDVGILRSGSSFWLFILQLLQFATQATDMFGCGF